MRFEVGERYAVLVVGRPVMVGDVGADALVAMQRQAHERGAAVGIDLTLAVAMGADADRFEGEPGILGTVLCSAAGDAPASVPSEVAVERASADARELLDALVEELGLIETGGESLPFEGAFLWASPGATGYLGAGEGLDDLEEREALGEVVRVTNEPGTDPYHLDEDGLADLAPTWIAVSAP
ncbi:MAG: hypothetical protein KC619_01960 [Myxococcales bacterium]|nr:hypothetical protein [Myxococcales bacterium]